MAIDAIEYMRSLPPKPLVIRAAGEGGKRALPYRDSGIE
jgi:hypothetical protein